MLKFLVLLVFMIFLKIHVAHSIDDRKIVCYYTNWAQYRDYSKARFIPSHINPSLCTHIIYAFAKLEDGVLAEYEWNDADMYSQVIGLKRKNPSLKVLIAVGGWNLGSKPFSDMASKNDTRKKFVKTAVQFLKSRKFDGLDLDWEYPGSREGSTPEDKKRFTDLVIELKEAFKPYNLLLSAAVGAGKETIDKAYEIEIISKHLDFINLMAYDLHGSWESFTGFSAPLYNRTDEDEDQSLLNVNWAVQYWISNGAPRDKLCLGLGTYGRTFRLANKDNNKPGDAATGPGSPGQYTREAGFMSYYEICQKLQQGWTREWETEQKVPYAYGGNEWVGYDDIESLTEKVEYIKREGLHAMFWALDLDDFSGTFCGQGKYPLISSVYNQLTNKSAVVLTTKAPVSLTTVSSVKTETTKAVETKKEKELKIVCYYTNWAQYRDYTKARFIPTNIDPTLCTHIIYAFAKLEDGILAEFEWNDADMYSQVIGLKRKNSNLKVLIAVGGWNLGSQPFSDMASNNSSRKRFVTTTIQFLKSRKFDGLDLDWEYPGSREGSRPEDKQRFTDLVIELKAAFKPYNFLLSAAVGAGKSTIDKGYEIEIISKHLDFINLMAYDLHGSWESFTGFSAPLYNRTDEDEDQSLLNVNWAVQYWISNGAPRDKLCLGLGTYGRTFRLANKDNNKPGDAATGPGSPGQYTREAGFMSYYEICQKLQQGWTREWETEQKVPYAYGGNEWVGYDDIESLTEKVEYIKREGLHAMFWALDLDDFSGTFCGQGKYPLISSVYNQLTNKSPSILTTKAPQVPSTVTTVGSVITETTESVETSKELEASIATTQSVTLSTLLNTVSSGSESASTSETSEMRILDRKVVCFYSNFTKSLDLDQNRFLPKHIDPFLCTHLIYAFAKIENGILEPSDEDDEKTYGQIMMLKKQNPNLKIMLAIGGWNMSSQLFSDMILNKKSRNIFVSTTIQFLRNKQFDGLDLFWEYPGSREGSTPEDKQRFTNLVIELQTKFQQYQLLLSATVSARKTIIDNAYEIDKISKYLDFINLMTYDFHGSWESFTGFSAPLYNRTDEDEDQSLLNVNWAVQYWISNGAPRDKLCLGLGTYGRTFRLANKDNNKPGDAATGPGSPGQYTREAGFMSYYEICQKLQQGWTREWETEQKVPYAYGGNEWVGYDDIESLTEKVEYIKREGLHAMFWALDLDDFSGTFCGQGKYPLISFVSNQFAKPENSVTASVTADDFQNLVTSQNHNLCAKGDGFYSDIASNCEKYYRCINNNVYWFSCPDNTAFDVKSMSCEWKEFVKCV